METTNAKVKPKKKIGKILLFGTASLIIIVTVVHVIWKMSGSNEWKLKIDKNGTKVYTLKSPGNNMILVKGVAHWKYTMSQCVAPFFDESIQDDPGKWLPMCTYYKIIRQQRFTRLETNLQLYRWNFPFPFSPREVLVQGQVNQDSVTKEVVLENIAVQNAVPRTDGYVRTGHHHNVWRFTPKGNGDVEVEFLMDMNFDGFFPDMLTNIKGASQVYKILAEDYPKLMVKYQNAKFNFIEELEVKPK
jgi:START domain